MSTLEETLPPVEAGILERLLEPGFDDLSPEFARRLVALEFQQCDADRLHALGAKARAGTLTPDEDAELEAYLRVGHMLNILKLKARSFLRRSDSGR
jgi:hypothetical protein